MALNQRMLPRECREAVSLNPPPLSSFLSCQSPSDVLCTPAIDFPADTGVSYDHKTALKVSDECLCSFPLLSSARKR